MKDKIIAILEDTLSVTDEWGGTKLAGWQWGHNVLVAGIEDAAQEIVEALKPSHNKQMAAALLKLSLQCSNYDDGIRYCDFCGHCINHKEFSAKDHIDDCPLKVLGERLNS